jgi:hypothetical protein
MSNPSRFETRKNNTSARNEQILLKFNELYKVQRIRYDDCIQKLAESFFLTPAYLQRLLSETSSAGGQANKPQTNP